MGETSIPKEIKKLAIQDEKLAISPKKLANESIKLAIEKQEYNEPTKNNILMVYENIDTNQIFWSTEIRKILDCAASNARLYMQKLCDMQVICEI